MARTTSKRALVLAAAVAATLSASAQAAATGWANDADGDYNAAGKWVNNDINGIWDLSLTLTAARTVTFADNTTLSTPLSFLYTGAFNLALNRARIRMGSHRRAHGDRVRPVARGRGGGIRDRPAARRAASARDRRTPDRGSVFEGASLCVAWRGSVAGGAVAAPRAGAGCERVQPRAPGIGRNDDSDSASRRIQVGRRSERRAGRARHRRSDDHGSVSDIVEARERVRRRHLGWEPPGLSLHFREI